MKATHTERENWRTSESSTQFWYSKLNDTEQFVIRFTLIVALIFTIAYIVANIDVLEMVRVINDFAANVITEVISIAVTVLIIERLNQRRATEQQKAELILQMGSPDNGFGLEAVRKLEYYGWLTDGSLEKTRLVEANLQGAVLRSANLRKTWLIRANLQEARLWEVNLQQADLADANVQQANLVDANLQQANLWDANLQKASFRRSNLRQTDLTSAHLQKARLYKADLQQADLWEANLQQADLTRANLRWVKNINEAIFDTETTLPNSDKWHEGYDLTIFTDPEHPDFWEPDWVKRQRDES